MAAAGLRDHLGDRVSGASVAVFRIAFGVIAAFVAARWLAYGWVDALLVDPPIHFTYPGFGWLRPLPGIGMHLVAWVVLVGGCGVAIGYRTRIGAAVVAVGMAYVLLIDQTLYINHYYWMILTAGLLALAPSHRTWAVDAYRRPRPGDGTIPRGWLWVLRFQVGMVYVFAGLAKIGSDWLVEAQPLATWLPARADTPLIGTLLALPTTAHLMSWAGLLFDLTIIGWLLWHRTRPAAFGTVVGFHLVTWLLFPSIGVFPWPMIAGVTLFFAPDWPVRFVPHRAAVQATPALPSPPWRLRTAAVMLVVYLVVMVAMPLRHLAGDGDLMWAGADYRFGWRVMLTEKSGTVDFVVTDPVTGSTWVEPAPFDLTPRQVEVMAVDPVLIRKVAVLIARRHLGESGRTVEVRADSHMAFNGRPHARLVDPAVDLANLAADTPVTAWVLAPPDRLQSGA